MRSKLPLLLVLLVGTVVFMSFLIKESGNTKKLACEKKDCCNKPLDCPETENGKAAPNGSLNHLIVSNLK